MIVLNQISFYKNFTVKRRTPSSTIVENQVMAQKSYKHFNKRSTSYPHQQLQHLKHFDLLFEDRIRVNYCNDYNSQFTSNAMHHKDPLCDSTSTRRTRRTRTTFSPNQIAELEQNFLQASYLTPERLAKVSAKLGLATTQVKIWFKNRRRRKKLSMERDRPKDESYPCSVSPSSLTDQIEYPGPRTPPEGLVANTNFITSASMGTDPYGDSSVPYYYNNTNNNRTSNYAPPAVWPAQYHNSTHHQQYGYQHKPPPAPLADASLKTSGAEFSLNKQFPCCNLTATPPWNTTNGMATAQSLHSQVYDPPISKNNEHSGINARVDGFQNESTAKLQQILDLCDGFVNDGIEVKKETTGNDDSSQIMDVCPRTFYNYNKTPNETQESDLYRTMDTIIKSYNYKSTPTQFAYCFS